MTITWGSSWAVAALPGSPGESASAASAACDTAPARTIEPISASSAVRCCGYLADCGCKPREHSAQRAPGCMDARIDRSEEHTSELQSRLHLVCRLLLEKKKDHYYTWHHTTRDTRCSAFTRTLEDSRAAPARGIRRAAVSGPGPPLPLLPALTACPAPPA